MKKSFLIAVILLALLGAVRATPFAQYFYNPDGTPQTNSFTLTAYPPTSAWTIVGTNLYFGGAAIPFTPTTNGYVSNSISAGTYSLLFSNLNSGFYVTIPNTTNLVSLAACATSVPTISGTVFNSFGLVTNWLGYQPATNAPATNTIIFVSSITTFTNASGAVTNLTFNLTTNIITYQLR